MNNTTSNNNYNQALIKLKNLGLLNDNVIEVNDNFDESSPWFINVFFGFTGILASVFFIGFLTLLLFETAVFDSFMGLLIVGILLSIAGGGLFYNARMGRSYFCNSLAFAITLAGQGYIAFALLFEGFEPPLGALILLLVQLVMTIIIPNFIYRLLSATFALSASFYLLTYYHIAEVSLGLYALITIVTNLQRYSLLCPIPKRWRAPFLEIISATAYASAFILLNVSVAFIAAEYGGGFDSYGAFGYNYYLAQTLLTLASLYAVYLILKRYAIKLLSATGLIIVSATAVLGVVSIYVSGLLATSLIIVIAVANSQRVLLGLGIIALIGYIFWYYYQLDTSLLLKSASMLIVAIGLILIRWLLIKHYFADEKLANINTGDNQERLL